MEARQQNQASGIVDVRMHNEERKVKGDAVSDHVQRNGKVRDTRGQTDQRLRRYYLTMDSPYRPT